MTTRPASCPRSGESGERNLTYIVFCLVVLQIGIVGAAAYLLLGSHRV